LKTDYHTAI